MIYDCFTFFNELDLLELRLQELKDVVDRFVLVEATKTFSNNPKPLCYQENKERFKDFQEKIIHIVVDDLPENPKDSWENQYFQRNAIVRGLVNCSPDDIIIISDLDEIPRASAIAGFKGEIAFLEQNLYYYRLNCLCTTAKWAIPIILRYRNLTTPQEVRMYWYNRERRTEFPTIPNAGWHFSYLGDVEAIQLKLNSFSQQDFNTPEVNNKENIEAKIDAAQDLFDRPEFEWTFVKIDETYPRAIYANKYKYASYIKGRDLKSTIFFDQYSRYKSCAEIVEAISNEKSTILDVGSGTDCLMGDFLPHLNISYVDPLIANTPTRPPYMIGGDAFSPELNGRTFDCVVSIDALEHVPASQRESFIERLCALAEKAVIIAFPAADAGNAIETDLFINNVYKEAYGTDYRWLDEHLENGLPSLQDVLDILAAQGFETSVRQNGHTPWMQELLPFTLCGFEIEGFKDDILGISTFFNEHLQCHDNLTPAYRQIVVATKPLMTVPVLLESVTGKRQEADALWEKVRHKIVALPFHKLREAITLVKQKESLIAEMDKALTDGKKVIEDKTEFITQLNQRLDQRQYELEQSGREMTEKNRAFALQENKLAELEQAIANHNVRLAERELEVCGHVAHISELDSRVENLNRTLAELEAARAALCAELENKLSQYAEKSALQQRALEDLQKTQELLKTQLCERDAMISAKSERIAGLEEHVADQNARLTERDMRIAGLQARVDELVNSLSWRITGPARTIADFFMRK